MAALLPFSCADLADWAWTLKPHLPFVDETLGRNAPSVLVQVELAEGHLRVVGAVIPEVDRLSTGIRHR